MWDNNWKKGIDYPAWGDTDVYKKTISGGYLFQNESPRDAYMRVCTTVAKRLGKPEMATYQTYQQIGMAEDVTDVIANISPTSTPMQSMFKTDKVHARTFEYQEDAIRASAVNAAVEGADASYITVAPTTMRSNTTQIFSEAFQVSNTAETVRTYGRAKEPAFQLAKQNWHVH